MAISSISDYYNSIINKTNSVSTTSSAASQPATSGSSASKTDTLDLSSYANDLSGYLNYNAGGQYNNLSSLADVLNSDSNSDSIDPMGDSSFDGLDSLGDSSGTNQMPSLADFLNGDGSGDSSGSGSSDGIFDTLIQENNTYTDYLIKEALNKMSQSSNQTQSSETANSTAPTDNVAQK